MRFTLENNIQFQTTSRKIIPPQKLTGTENGDIGHDYAHSFIFLDKKVSVKAHIVASQNIGMTQQFCNVTGDV
jgi:hypothetical protein